MKLRPTDYALSYSATDITVTDGVNAVIVQNCEFMQHSDRRELLSATANQPPSVQTPLVFATFEDIAVRIELTNVTRAIEDPENDVLELVFVNGAINGDVSLDAAALIFSPQSAPVQSFRCPRTHLWRKRLSPAGCGPRALMVMPCRTTLRLALLSACW